MTNEKDGEILNRIINIECGRDDNGFATCSPSALQTSISAALATVRAEEREAAWQLIDTAPKDKTYVIVALINKGVVWRVSEAAFNGLGWYDKGGTACHWRTHWMPLPAAPLEATENRKGEG